MLVAGLWATRSVTAARGIHRHSKLETRKTRPACAGRVLECETADYEM
jgi:hypothetical protein